MNPRAICSPWLEYEPNITVGDLSPKYIGKRVRITDYDNVHTGALADIDFEIETTHCGNYASTVTVEFRGGSKIVYPLSATVEVL